MPDTKQINVRLPAHSRKQMAAVGQRRGETRTQVIIAALNLLYENSHEALHYEVEMDVIAACPWCAWDGRPIIMQL